MVIQKPPAYSAKKIQGKRAYDLARAGQTVELAPRPVRIDRIAVIDYAWPHLELEIDCGGGTYIRSIARDIGDALGCGGICRDAGSDPDRPVHTRTGHRSGRPVGRVDRWPASARARCGAELAAAVLDAGQVEAIVQGKRLATARPAR